MHIVLFSEHYHKVNSGPYKAATAMTAAWLAAGHKVTILSMSPESRDFRLDCGAEVRQRRYRLKIVPVKFGRAPYYSWQLNRIHKQHPIDVVLAQGLYAGAAALRFRERHRVPFVLNPRSGLTAIEGHWKEAQAHRVLRACDACIGISRNATNEWRAEIGAAEGGKFHAIHNGVYPDAMQGPTAAPPGIPDTRPRILCMGMLRKVKGQSVLLDALAAVRDLPWHAVFSGDGRDAASIKAHCTKLGLDQRVSWTGLISGDQWRWAFANADLFALTPVYPEAFGNVFLEAQLAGLPVLTSAVGALPEFVLDGQTGFTVPHDDNMVLGIATRLRQLLQDADLRKRMGQAGIANARTMTWDKTAGQYLQVMQGVLATRV